MPFPPLGVLADRLTD